MIRALANLRYSISVRSKEMELFSQLTGWWHPAGPSQILYLYNYHRITFLRKHLPPHDVKQPLLNLHALDVGCGAGFLSESLARLGGNVIGLDPNPTSFTEAKNHQDTKSDLKNLLYYNMSLEDYLSSSETGRKTFDVVASMEVIEHVNDPKQFAKTLSGCTKANGLVMLSTIRRSNRSWLTHILLAERLLNIVPPGTHHHEQFINPEECADMLRDSGVDPIDILELELNASGSF